jgi:pyruvate,water dikinase
MGVRPAAEADLAAGLEAIAKGESTVADFLNRFGHRGGQEMELSCPRWAEEPTAVERLVNARPAGLPNAPPRDFDRLWQQLIDEAKVPEADRPFYRAELEALRSYLGLRETAKHYFLLGYGLIRRYLVELDRRHGLGGGVFFLLPDELPRLTSGHDLSALIAERRRRRTTVLSLEVPAVLFSDELDVIGRPLPGADGHTLQGIPLSAGSAEGPALVLERPEQATGQEDGYVLVCQSTDPAWVPLFLKARGLVMETGGVLSHGAIVAREFGLPAVAGLPGILRQVRTGQQLRVDGTGGSVAILSDPSE